MVGAAQRACATNRAGRDPLRSAESRDDRISTGDKSECAAISGANFRISRARISRYRARRCHDCRQIEQWSDYIAGSLSVSSARTGRCAVKPASLPAVYPFRYWVTSGGLAFYGIDNIELYRQAATYVDRILKGEKPVDLPVQNATKFELVINLKTAKELGINPSNSLLARTDEVIE